VSIIVGIVTGAGIYESTALTAGSPPHAFLLIGTWVVGGLISLIGALCYAELATRHPEEYAILVVVVVLLLLGIAACLYDPDRQQTRGRTPAD